MFPSLRKLVLVALVAGAAPLASACYVGEDEPAAEYGYEPAYYDGAVVYYDDYGRPFYYSGGAALYITPGMPRYDFYVNHYRRYRPYYHRWYTNRGYRYRTYRGGGFRGGYRGGYHGGYHRGVGRRR